ncbi:DNA primase [Cacatuid alphaherpesvirus 2]|uniref:DNA primase n=1 Tax=Cacatuid alphaherpesvirus 2 TaxID=2604840 RepID=A0A5B9QZT0_9ALPH|nr:DNA primase [Cacatuid alphaherpesvirus 2]QEG54041.1 DNA primase [Cacatuid alphaherpesvirus 2]
MQKNFGNVTTKNPSESIEEDISSEDDYLFLDAMLTAEHGEINCDHVSCNEIEEIRILYATEGYPIVCSLHLLLGQALLPEIYIICYSHVKEIHKVDKTGIPLKATFYLLANTGCEERRQRIRPMFVCLFKGSSADAVRDAMAQGAPLSAQMIISALDINTTFSLHEEVIIALGVICHQTSGKKHAYTHIASSLPCLQQTLASLMLQHETRVVAAFRRLYNANFSGPFWFVSKFGPSEISLVAAMRYYLLDHEHDIYEIGRFDLQGIKDLSITYPAPLPNKSGLTPARLNTFAEFSKFWCCSDLAGAEAERSFRNHLVDRHSSDSLYVRSLDSLIEKYRHVLRLPAKDFVGFVYLAYHEGYNRAAIDDHLHEALKNAGKALTASQRAQGDFFKGLREMCNMREYFTRNVCVKVKRLPIRIAKKHALLRSYGELPRSGFAGFCLSPYDVSFRINKLYAGTLCKYGTQLADVLSRTDASAKSTDADILQSTVTFDSDDFSEDVKSNDTTTILGKREYGTNHLRARELETRSPLSRLTALAFSDQRIRGLKPISILFKSSNNNTPSDSKSTLKITDHPVPVYRVAMPRGCQAFSAIAMDSWDSEITKDVFENFNRPMLQVNETYTFTNETEAAAIDASWTHALTQKLFMASLLSNRASCLSTAQMYKNRNEVLSDSMAVGNLLLDLDIKIKHQCAEKLSMFVLHKAARSMRDALVSLWTLLFPEAGVEPDTYPVYFYKTQCIRNNSAVSDVGSLTQDNDEHEPNFDEDIQGWEEDVYSEMEYTNISYEDDLLCAEEQHCINAQNDDSDAKTIISELIAQADTRYCECKEKLGFRVCIPIPKPYALAGLAAARTAASLAQQAILLQDKFVEALDKFIADYEFVDCGVFSSSRSLRLPFFSKVDSRGFMVGRLLPFIIFPPKCEDRLRFVMQHSDPNNFHSACFRPDNPTPTLIVTEVTILRDVLARDREVYTRSRGSGGKLIDALVSAGILECRNNDWRDGELIDPKTVLEETALPAVKAYLEEHFPQHAREYDDVHIESVRVSDTRIYAVLRRGRGDTNYRSKFTCLKYQHRGSSVQTVIASVTIAVNTQGLPYVALQTRCFATKCGSNSLQTQFSVVLGHKDV